MQLNFQFCLLTLVFAIAFPPLALASLGELAAEEKTKAEAEATAEPTCPEGEKVCVWHEEYGNHYENPEYCQCDEKPHGKWEERFPDGTIANGPYINNQEHDIWKFHRPDGAVVTIRYILGQVQQ